MLKINQYVRAQSLDEAYALCQKKSSVVLGGMMWLKMEDRPVGTAIDLCDLGLDRIEEKEDGWHIGAMVTLRQLEQHPGLGTLTGGALAQAVGPIVGGQFRNLATVGGSIWGRFGFSDLLTVFLALGAEVVLHGAGRMPLETFAAQPEGRDILAEILLPKQPVKAACCSMRNTATDFPVLVAAAGIRDGQVRCAVGARPAKAALLTDEQGLLAGGVTPESAQAFADWAAEKLSFDSNIRGSADYRRTLCRVLVRRALLAAQGEEA